MSAPNPLRVALQEAQTCLDRGELLGAEAALKKAVALDSRCVPALFNLGNLALGQGEAARAVTWFERVLDLQPELLPALQNLGSARLELGQMEDARTAFARMLAIQPDHGQACHNLGVVSMRLGETAEARVWFQRALVADPALRESALNLVFLALEEGDLAEAEALMRKVLALDPDSAAALNAFGAVLERSGKDAEALSAYRRAVALEPTSADYRFNLATQLLRMGCWDEGWTAFEARLQTPFCPPRRPVALWWKGFEDAEGPLLVLAEQGLGDTIQFCRYLAELPSSLRPTFLVQPGMEGLMGRVAGAVRVVGCDLREALPEGLGCRFQVPLLSLPRILGTREATIPAQVPYLRPLEDRVGRFRMELAGISGRKAGLVFAGNPRHLRDRRRSCPFAQLRPLLDQPGMTFFSLQQGEAASALAGDDRIRNWAPLCLDLEDLAAALSCLDLLITVDTMPAHLAGALGRPVWLLLDDTPDWRWMRARTDSPWYPTLKAFRQPAPGDWASVIQEVCAELATVSPRTGR